MYIYVAEGFNRWGSVVVPVFGLGRPFFLLSSHGREWALFQPMHCSKER